MQNVPEKTNSIFVKCDYHNEISGFDGCSIIVFRYYPINKVV